MLVNNNKQYWFVNCNSIQCSGFSWPRIYQSKSTSKKSAEGKEETWTSEENDFILKYEYLWNCRSGLAKERVWNNDWLETSYELWGKWESASSASSIAAADEWNFLQNELTNDIIWKQRSSACRKQMHCSTETISPSRNLHFILTCLYFRLRLSESTESSVSPVLTISSSDCQRVLTEKISWNRSIETLTNRNSRNKLS